MIACVEITTWYLEQLSPAELRRSRLVGEVVVTRAEIVSPELNRYLYAAVGGDWFWLDRLGWDWQRWHAWLSRPGVETWVAYVHGTPCGYVELDGSVDGSVEIAYFGLLPAFAGKGIGGHLLTVAIEHAWSLASRWPGRTPTQRVWVQTCNLDGPAALANYQARGLALYKTETETAELPAETPGPWPGAGRPR